MRAVLKKLCGVLVTLLIISFLTYLAFQIIPADPTTKMLGTQYTPERAEALRHEFGLDRPVLLRYLSWLAGAVHGDFGVSYIYRIPVSELLRGKILNSAVLTLTAFILIILISIPTSLALARREGSAPDRVMLVAGQFVMSVPSFFIGIIFTGVFGLTLSFFVVGDLPSPSVDFWGFMRYIFFAALSIALPKSAMTVKLLRSGLLSELGQDYVRTAYSRGHSRKSALYSHVLRNAVLPAVTFLAMTLADIVAGSIIIEQVFSIPGLGRLLLTSISNRDYPVVQAIVVMIAAIVVCANYGADFICRCLDPRIRIKQV